MAEVSNLDKMERAIVLIKTIAKKILPIFNGFFPFALNITFLGEEKTNSLN